MSYLHFAQLASLYLVIQITEVIFYFFIPITPHGTMHTWQQIFKSAFIYRLWCVLLPF